MSKQNHNQDNHTTPSEHRDSFDASTFQSDSFSDIFADFETLQTVAIEELWQKLKRLNYSIKKFLKKS